MIIKILKNTTQTDIILINMLIPKDEQVDIEPTMWAKLLQNGKVFEYINNGTLILNNGTNDLDIPSALRHIALFQSEENVSVAPHFSFRKILSGVTVTVPEEEQMIEYQEICIANTGELNIEGEVVIII